MRRWISLVLTVSLVVVSTEVGIAQQPGYGQAWEPGATRPEATIETSVRVSPSGVTIYIGVTSTADGSPGDLGTPEIVGDPSGPTCGASAMNLSYTSATSGGWMRVGLQENPGTVPYSVSCDNGYFAIAWVPMEAPGTPSVVVGTPPDGRFDSLAASGALYGIVPLPPISLGANPGTGLVALSSWFWVDGYDGGTLYGSETLGDTTVEVEITPERYDWHFGDGAFISTMSVGRAYPQESEIQHTYEQSSRVAGGQFDVILDVVFGGRYRVITEEDDGEGGTVVVVGDWEALDPTVRSFSEPYAVQQSQAVLTAGQ